jgi:flagellar protein FlaG
MDVEFSQIGQNFAVQPARQEKAEIEELKTEKSGLSDSNSNTTANDAVKVSEASVDNTTEVSSTPVSIESAVAEVSEFVQAKNRQLDFSIDEKSQRSVVRVTDSESGDVIRQIPSEEVLALSERIKDLQSDVGAAVGVLFNKQA